MSNPPDWSTLARDIFCPLCGYNLRGLSENRCPECGHQFDCVNPLYDDSRSPDSDAGRAAFAKWAVAGAKHFAGKKILWEMYNEPNISPFWRPKVNHDDYVKLAVVVGKALKREAPGETYIGPACSTMDFPFLEKCFVGGMLEYWDAVSVHPYRQQMPETVIEDYRRLRGMIEKHAPARAGKKIPILSGEWGYSAVWEGYSDERQGKYFPRQWLTNLSNDVGLSIWYDWHDDGTDAKEPEHHFGTVTHGYEPKPAYKAMKTLTSVLGGFKFNKRLAGDEGDYVLLFERGQEVAVVAWTTAGKGHEVTVPASPGLFSVIDHVGTPLQAIDADEKRGLRVKLTDAPLYLVPQKQPNEILRVAAAWERLPLEVRARAADVSETKVAADFANPLEIPLSVRRDRNTAPIVLGPEQRLTVSDVIPVTRGERERTAQLSLYINDVPEMRQSTRVVVTDPIEVRVCSALGDSLPVEVSNPGGDEFEGTVAVRFGTAADDPVKRAAVRFQKGETRQLVTLKTTPAPGYTLGVNLLEKGKLVSVLPPTRHVAFPLDGLAVRAEGDEKVASEQAWEVGKPQEIAGETVPAGRVTYRFAAGWKYLLVSPKKPMKLEGKPSRMGMWLKGDGSGNVPRLRFADSTGQTFQPDAEALTYRDWRYVEFPLDGTKGGHWGGAKDGVIHHPIALTTLLLIDSAGRSESEGEVWVVAPVVAYE